MYIRHHYIKLFLKWNPPIKWYIPRSPRKHYNFDLIDETMEWGGEL